MTTSYSIYRIDCVSGASGSVLVEVVLHPSSTSLEAIDAACPRVQSRDICFLYCISFYRLLTTSGEALYVMFLSNERRIQ